LKDDKLSDITNSPARVRILEIIGEKGSVSFTEIKRETGLSTGSIYYHLYYLKDYVARDADRRYSLTDKGRRLLEKLGMKTLVKEKTNLAAKSLSIITLAPIFKHVTQSRQSCIIAIILTLTFGSIANLYSSSNQFLLSVPGKEIMDPIASTLVTGWLLTFFLAELFSFITTEVRIGGELELITTIALSFIPLYIYSYVSNLQFSNIVLVPMQIWSAILLAGSLNISKGVKLTYSFIFSLIVLYVSIYIWFTV
jgi:DNA-binding MarR family transcriptional regulator